MKPKKRWKQIKSRRKRKRGRSKPRPKPKPETRRHPLFTEWWYSGKK